MSRDSSSEIPSFTANRDEAVTSAPRGAVPSRGRPAAAGGGGLGALGRLTLTVAVVVAAVACAWAYQLQVTLDLANSDRSALATRVADLEALLSDTDESVEQSAAALGAQLRVVDKETRRLEQRRREHDARIDKLEKQGESTTSDLASLLASSKKQNSTLTSLSSDMAGLKAVAGDLERLTKTAQEAQTNMERMADNVNKANLERAAINKRVAENTESMQSVDAFRRQVLGKISQLEAGVRELQASGAPLQ